MRKRAYQAKALALIPAYNEAAHIGAVVRSTLPYLPVLVIDDGSRDETAALAVAAGAIVLRQQSNQGKGAALQAGFRWVSEHNHQTVVMLDADGQHDPSEIPRFLQRRWTTQADLIIGQRDFDQMPPVRRLANQLGGIAFSWALGETIADNQSGYRLLSRRMIQAMLESKEHGFEYEVEMIVTCVQHGFKLDWVPIRTIYAGEASHINPLRHLVNFIRIVWQTRRQTGKRKP